MVQQSTTPDLGLPRQEILTSCRELAERIMSSCSDELLKLGSQDQRLDSLNERGGFVKYLYLGSDSKGVTVYLSRVFRDKKPEVSGVNADIPTRDPFGPHGSPDLPSGSYQHVFDSAALQTLAGDLELALSIQQ